MPVSQCTRCDQLIEYDASHEGDEVLCPACDNITRLKPLPEDALPEDNPEGANNAAADRRSPIRLVADELPPPAADPVAATGAPELADDPRGPDLTRSADDETTAMGSNDRPSSEFGIAPAEAIAYPDAAADRAEIRILAAESLESDGRFHLDVGADDQIRLRVPLDRPFLLGAITAAVLGVLWLMSYLVLHTPERERVMSVTDLQAVLAAQPRLGLTDPEPPPPDRPAVEPEPEPPTRPTVVGAMEKPAGESVAVRFPNLPTELLRDTDRAESEAYRFYVESAFNEPYRLFGDTVLDLRTLRFAANVGMVDYPDNWHLVGGLIQGRSPDGLLLRVDRRLNPEANLLLVPDFPEIFVVRRDQPLGVLVRRTGSKKIKLGEGDEQVVETFEFGLLPSEPMVKIAQLRAVERESVVRRQMEAAAKKQADEAAAEEARRKKELDARTVNFLRERVKKGFASAQFRLGLRYLEGDGVPRNRDEGLRLLRAAAAQGYRDAKSRLKEMGLE